MSRPTWEAATRAQYDDDANLAARQALFEYLVDATPLAAPLDDLSSLANQRVLDLGCGNGHFLHSACQGGANASGCDLSLGMVQTARANAAAPVCQADAHDLPYADDVFDVVLALWMLYHLDERPKALAEVARVLGPHGRLVATTNSEDDGDLGRLITGGLSDVLGRTVKNFHPPLPFTAENGASILGRVFPVVTTHPFGTTFAVTDPLVVVRYAGSMLGPMHTLHGDFDDAEVLSAVGRRCAGALADGRAVRIERRGAVFVSQS